MALSISMTTKIDRDTVDPCLVGIEVGEKMEQSVLKNVLDVSEQSWKWLCHFCQHLYCD
jgi:hypothetical protein